MNGAVACRSKCSPSSSDLALKGEGAQTAPKPGILQSPAPCTSPSLLYAYLRGSLGFLLAFVFRIGSMYPDGLHGLFLQALAISRPYLTFHHL